MSVKQFEQRVVRIRAETGMSDVWLAMRVLHELATVRVEGYVFREIQLVFERAVALPQAPGLGAISGKDAET